MLQTTELRIGNFLQDQAGDIVRVDSIQNAGINLAHYPDNGEPEYSFFPQREKYVTPILLTKQWLEKFGFEQIGTADYLLDPTSAQLIVEQEGLRWRSKSTKVLPLRYVHQLQNRYFALTGEELQLR